MIKQVTKLKPKVMTNTGMEQMAKNIEKLNRQMAGLVIDEELLKSNELYLIPFVQDGKIGMINHNAEIIIKPEYDNIPTKVFTKNDLIRVCKNKKWGVINTQEEIIIPIDYDHIFADENMQIFTLNRKYKTWVINRENEVIVSPDKYEWIDEFHFGYAKVMIHNENGEKVYGIINNKGEVVLPIECSNIWNFKKTNFPKLRVEWKGFQLELPFSQLEQGINLHLYLTEKEHAKNKI